MLDLLRDFALQTELTQMSVILVVVLIITWFLKVLKQPIVVGYLIAWIVVGPVAFGFVEVADHSFVELFSHLWIALLLFMVWLWLNPKVIKEHGKTAMWVWCAQIIWTVVLWLIVDKFLWFDWVTSAYIAAGLTFSSTIVIVKLLSDKEDQETLYGKIALWVLIIQDIVVMLLLMGVSIFGGAGEVSTSMMLWWWLGSILGVWILSKWVLPKVLDNFAHMQEFLLLMGIGWCLLLGSVFWYFWFSFEIGALIAWMSFALSPYRREIANQLKPLRDFFLVLFFIHIGMQLQFDAITQHWFTIVVLSIFVSVVKPLLIWVSTKWYGFTNKTALKSALSLWQISEFSFLLIGIGISAGHIQDTWLLSVMMFVGLITITLSSYWTIYNNTVYGWWRKTFGEQDSQVTEHNMEDLESVDVILFGYGRMWEPLAHILEDNGRSYLVVDHNPEVMKVLDKKWVPAIYGDATNDELYKELLKRGVKMVISTIRDVDDDRLLIKTTKSIDEEIITLVVSNHVDEALELYDHGADYVIMPDYISAHHAWLMLEEVWMNLQKIVWKKQEHIENIESKAKMWLVSMVKR